MQLTGTLFCSQDCGNFAMFDLVQMISPDVFNGYLIDLSWQLSLMGLFIACSFIVVCKDGRVGNARKPTLKRKWLLRVKMLYFKERSVLATEILSWLFCLGLKQSCHLSKIVSSDSVNGFPHLK